ncbi:MAG: VWA domain-containing protein [Planctomycetia bacterium]|nr:VWA domain-containing protein [Planctomycetia bacterium]
MSGSNQQARQQSEQVPQHLLQKEFGKVYVRTEGAVRHVEFTVWVPELGGSEAEGWQTGVALDASASMKTWYGRNLSGAVPEHVAEEYKKKGWVKEATHDGRRVFTFTREAYDDAIARKFVKFTDNIVEPLARDFIAYLAGQLDADGGTTFIYWACGSDGSAYEAVGDFTEEQCRKVDIRGPQKQTFGNGTRLTPAVRYFADRFQDAERGLYVFLTDGRLDDIEELKRYSTDLAKGIAAGKRKPIKCVLIGIGDEIDEGQMEELDDLDTGTDVDIWDHKIAADLRGVNEIIVELVDETRMVSDTPATIYDASGAVVAQLTDGLPAKVTFTMPATSAFFELEIGDKRIRQPVVA